MRTALALIALAILGYPRAQAPAVKDPDAPLEAFAFDELSRELAESGGVWKPFLDRPSLYTGVYRLAAGAADGQSPHEHDEVYYVVRGRATLEAAGERTPAGPGAILFVAAGVPHRFVDIAEDLEVLVFFSRAAPAEEPSALPKEE